ncbi:PucR family transcriptional regulator [Streptomyces mexicanus]|uniref:PucR family transcriptional regulator n=1 Tax=Streptomyces mexicanus TaxID=178566 RepID=UPI001359E8BC|nr:PucR family transcriptional regulator [Streptomyces mexicanus]
MGAEMPSIAEAPGELAPERVLAVVRVFDRLIAGSASLDDVLAAAAREGECLAGMSTADGRNHRAVDGTGEWSATRPEERRGALLADGTEVWVAGCCLPEAHVELVVERLWVAAGVALRQARDPRPVIDPTTALEVVLSAGADEVGRARALRVLELSPARQVVVAAYDGPPSTDADLLSALPAETVLRAGRIGSRLALVLAGPPDSELPIPRRGRMGFGSAYDWHELPRAWHQARVALRYALRSSHGGPQRAFTEATIVDFADLGAWAILAEHLPVERLRLAYHPDVAALDRLVEQAGGDDMRCTLETVAATGSIRQAAAVLHLHHNSVAHRVARAEAELGFQIGVPYGRSRLLVALIIQRLRDNV